MFMDHSFGHPEQTIQLQMRIFTNVGMLQLSILQSESLIIFRGLKKLQSDYPRSCILRTLNHQGKDCKLPCQNNKPEVQRPMTRRGQKNTDPQRPEGLAASRCVKTKLREWINFYIILHKLKS